MLGFNVPGKPIIHGIAAGYFFMGELITESLNLEFPQPQAWTMRLLAAAGLILCASQGWKSAAPALMAASSVLTHYFFSQATNNPFILGLLTTAWPGAIGLLLNRTGILGKTGFLKSADFLPTLASASFFISGFYSQHIEESNYFTAGKLAGNFAALAFVGLTRACFPQNDPEPGPG